MAMHLIVTNPFGDYPRGARIDDPEKVEEIRASHNAHNAVPIVVDEQPEAALAPT